MRQDDRQLGKPLREYRNTKANVEALGLVAADEGCIAYATDTDMLGAFDGAAWHWSDLDVTVPDHDHTGDVGDGGQISHDTALTNVSADDHHSETHVLATTGPHTGALPLTDLGSYAEGRMVIGGAASDWTVLAPPAAAGYALVSGATSFAWDQTPAWTGRHSFADGITFNGIAGANSIIVPDLADAFDITDASGTEFLRLDTSANAYFLIDPAGAGIKVGIGTPTPGSTLELHAPAGSNAAFWLSDADVSHPFTGVGFAPEIQADVLGATINASGLAGGVQFLGFSDADTTPFYLYGHIGNASPTATAVIIGGWKTDGGTSRAALAAAEKVLQIHNGATILATMLGSGNLGLGCVPTQALHISGAASPVLRVQDTTNNAFIDIFCGNTVGYIGTGSAHEVIFLTNSHPGLHLSAANPPIAKIPSLAGVGVRNVVAAADGTLSAP